MLDDHFADILEMVANRTRTSLIVQKDNKISTVKPKYKYVRVPIKTTKQKAPSLSRRKAKSRT